MDSTPIFPFIGYLADPLMEATMFITRVQSPPVVTRIDGARLAFAALVLLWALAAVAAAGLLVIALAPAHFGLGATLQQLDQALPSDPAIWLGATT
jgi:hypothetical protein